MAYLEGFNYSSYKNLEVRDGVVRFKTQLSSSMDTTSQPSTYAIYSKNQKLCYWNGSVEHQFPQPDAVTVTPTQAGASIPVGTRFVTVDARSASDIIILPSSTPGQIIWLNEIEGGTGYELRTHWATTVAINSGSGVGAESAIPASSLVRMICVTGSNWVGRMWTYKGSLCGVEVAAA